MNKQITYSQQFVLPAAITTIFLLCTFCTAFVQTKGAITEQEVKNSFIGAWTHSCDKSDDCSVTFDSAVRIAPAVQHTFQIPAATY